MLTVTGVAAARLDNLLNTHRRSRKDKDAVLRMVQKNRRFKLRVDSVHGGDVVFAYHGKALLVLDDWMARLLAGGQLTVHEVNGETRLQITRC